VGKNRQGTNSKKTVNVSGDKSFAIASEIPRIAMSAFSSPMRLAGVLTMAIGAMGKNYDNDVGDVTDESPVEGLYNPQMEGKVLMCTKGRFFSAGFCYEYCADGYEELADQCVEKGCKDGWTEVGLFCKKDGLNVDTKPRKTYKRSVGQPEECKLGDSFGPGAVEDNGNRDFTVIMASDVQLPWGSCTDDKNSDKGKKCAKEDNHNMVRGMHTVESMSWPSGNKEQVRKPIGVFLAGDITSYGHPWQLNMYRRIWETRDKEDQNMNIKMGVWPGLGNHDYFNNLNICRGFALEEPTWAPYLIQNCAQRMIAYIRAAVAGCDCHKVHPNFGGWIDHYEKKSAGYAVKYGRIRFAMLHNYPTYRRIELTGVASTMGFLKKQVKLAEENDEYLVLVMHDATDHFGFQYWFKQVARHDYYSEVLTGSRVIAVFAGHLHPQGGFKRVVLDSRHRTNVSDSNVNVKNAWGDEIPIMLGWAAEYMRFLTVQFNVAGCYWRYGSTSAPTTTSDTAQWFEPDYEKHMRIFQLRNCTVDPNQTWTDPEKPKSPIEEECKSQAGEVSGAGEAHCYPWSMAILILMLGRMGS